MNRSIIDSLTIKSLNLTFNPLIETNKLNKYDLIYRNNYINLMFQPKSFVLKDYHIYSYTYAIYKNDEHYLIAPYITNSYNLCSYFTLIGVYNDDQYHLELLNDIARLWRNNFYQNLSININHKNFSTEVVNQLGILNNSLFLDNLFYRSEYLKNIILKLF